MRLPYLPKAGPVRHGDGGGADLATQARHFTLDALKVIENQLKDADLDPKLRFAVARYLLELAWGRPRPAPAILAARETVMLTGALETRFLALLESMTDGDTAEHGRHDGAGADPGAGGGGMARDGAAGAADAER